MKSEIIKKLGKPFIVLKNAYNGFNDNNVIKLSASLAYFTLFSLPPLLVILITITGSIFGKEAVRGELFFEIRNLMGAQAAIQIQEIVKNIELQQHTGLITAFSFIILAFGASGIFSEIQSSLHLIWEIEPGQNKGFWHQVQNKLLSLSMIGSLSFLLMVSLFINSILDIAGNYLFAYFKDSKVILLFIINNVIVFLVVSVLFLLIYKTLPRKRLRWKYIYNASLFTSGLFMIGKYLISWYLSSSKLVSVYGAAGTLIILLIWVYYSAIILYFGAELAKAHAIYNNDYETVRDKPQST